MTMLFALGGVPMLRFPRNLYQALLELRSLYPKPVPAHTAGIIQYDPEPSRWKLVKVTQIPDPDDLNKMVNAWALTPYGHGIAQRLGPLSTDKRTLPPAYPLAEVMGWLPPEILHYLAQETPILKTEGGQFWERLGVLRPDPDGGSTYIQSKELKLALAIKAGGTVLPSAMLIPDMFDPTLMHYLHRASHGVGIPAVEKGLDGRALRPLGQIDGVGLIARVSPPGDTTSYYRVPQELRGFTISYLGGERRPGMLFGLLDEKIRRWFVSEFQSEQPHSPRLLERMGLVKRRGRHDWRWSRLGRALHAELTAVHRAKLSADEGVIDDSLYAGPGVEMLLPDNELTFALEADPFDILGEPDGPSDEELDADIYTQMIDQFDILGASPSSAPRVIGKHPALGMPYTPAPSPTLETAEDVRQFDERQAAIKAAMSNPYPSAPPPVIVGDRVVASAKEDEDSFDIL